MRFLLCFPSGLGPESALAGLGFRVWGFRVWSLRNSIVNDATARFSPIGLRRDPLGTLHKSCQHHAKRKRVGTTFAGQNLPGSPWRPAKVLQIQHKTEKGRNNFAGQYLSGSPWHPAQVLQIPHKTEEGRNNIWGSKFGGIPLAACKGLANTTQNGKG